jgi:hypothetical protein
MPVNKLMETRWRLLNWNNDRCHAHDRPWTAWLLNNHARLADVLVDAEVVVDVTNSSSFEDAAVLEFFEKSFRNLLVAKADTVGRHHVADQLSVPKRRELLQRLNV